MCGVFGYISAAGEGPDLSILRRLALVTATRGMHAFGLAWLDAGGRIETWKQPGPAARHLDQLDQCGCAVVMIGHCRYATHGSPRDNRNNHPHVAGAGYIVHNGIINNHDDLARRYHLPLRTECDSEILGHLMTRSGGSIAMRSAWVANQIMGELAILGIWRAPARLLIARRGRPLHFGQNEGGIYFASLPEGLPGKVKPVGDYSTRVLSYHKGMLRSEGAAIRLSSGGMFD